MLLQYKRKFPSWLNFVATSRPDESTKKELDPLSGAKIDVKDENNLEDIQCYVRSKIAGGNGGAAADQDEVVNKICERAAGVFMFASEVVRQYMEDESLDLDKLPEGLAELYMDRYKRTFKEDVSLVAFREHSAPMLAMLMASRGPLPREMVRVARSGGGGGEAGGEAAAGEGGSSGGGETKARSEDGQDQDQAWVAERNNHLEFIQRMCVGSLAEVGLFQFSHKSFPDWLSTNERFRVERKDGERLLGALCRAIVVREEVVGEQEEEEAAPGGAMIRDGEAAATNYALRNVIAHLVESGERESARELLMDVGYLCRRAEEGAALVQDCQRLEGDRTVELIGRTIGLSLNELRKDPRRMRGQLVGRLLSVVREVREGGGGEGEGKE